jgi:hypothetical protein
MPSILVLIVALAALTGVILVQGLSGPAWLEIAVRESARLLGVLAVPPLILLGSRTWAKSTREGLPIWRNGLGLSSIVIVASAWATDVVARVLFNFFNLDWMATLLFSSIFAGLLAIALKGSARLFILSAALLLIAGLESQVYF